MKLYRFRPSSAFIFKELMYQEFYCASSEELNDPLDLNANVNFYSLQEDELTELSRFILSQGFIANSAMQNQDAVKFFELHKSKKLMFFLKDEFKSITSKTVIINELGELLSQFFVSEGILGFSVSKLIDRIYEIFKKVINNCSITCFTSSVDNYLMWSHYASAHYGLCLEFDVEMQDYNVATLPLKAFRKNLEESLSYDIEILKISYENSVSTLEFYKFIGAFENVGDIDLISLSKARYHKYAHELKKLFTKKLSGWQYENEWRIVDVNFEYRFPDERILHFDINSVTGVYFGCKMSNVDKERVVNIFTMHGVQPTFYQTVISGAEGLRFFQYEKCISD